MNIKTFMAMAVVALTAACNEAPAEPETEVVATETGDAAANVDNGVAQETLRGDERPK